MILKYKGQQVSTIDCPILTSYSGVYYLREVEFDDEIYTGRVYDQKGKFVRNVYQFEDCWYSL